jgi:CRISPR/Cas system CMR-associated protein Cmr5 small subunit
MATRDQQRAIDAHRHVDGVPVPQRPKYRSMVFGLPALLRSAGLSQALHFIASRPDDGQKVLLGHLAEQLAKARGGGAAWRADDLLKKVREAGTEEYLLLTREALLVSAWYRRIVQSLYAEDKAAAHD